ncbi:MAG: hypothetical protein ABI165_03070 [Bryobacteraceae bacterium]
MAIDARFHFYSENGRNGLLPPDVAVTGIAGDFRDRVFSMAEEDEIRQLIYRLLGRDFRVFGQLHIDVASFAFRRIWKSCALGGFGGRVAIDALQF